MRCDIKDFVVLDLSHHPDAQNLVGAERRERSAVKPRRRLGVCRRNASFLPLPPRTMGDVVSRCRTRKLRSDVSMTLA